MSMASSQLVTSAGTGRVQTAASTVRLSPSGKSATSMRVATGHPCHPLASSGTENLVVSRIKTELSKIREFFGFLALVEGTCRPKCDVIQ